MILMKVYLVGAAVLLFLLLGMPAFGQSANASLSGTITDSSGGVLPKVNVTATNNATGIATSTVTNEAGVYTFPSLQPGIYKVTAELAEFQTSSFTDVSLRNSEQARLNFTLQLRKLKEEVEVTASSEQILLESGSSVGLALPEGKTTELPLVNNNVLDLLKVMGGVMMTDQNPVFAAGTTYMGGVSASDINLQRDGVSINEVRWESGLNSALRLNNEMIGEFQLILAPVDAEMGRGNGQMQLITKSGTNNYHGSLVWSLQNTGLDSNQFFLNKTNTNPNYRNLNEYTISAGGPIIKNKTFFYVLWDQALARERYPTSTMVLTPCARKGIFRYFDNWVPGNALAATVNSGFTPTTPSVDRNGNPVAPATNPDGTPFTGKLESYYVFGQLLKNPQTNDCSDFNPATDVVPGTAWDPYRTQLDPSGFISRFTGLMPLPNNYTTVGDGLNTAADLWTRGQNGGDNVFGMAEDNNRKQINVKIDHSFNQRNRVSGTYSFEKDTADDSFATWPNGYGGAIVRKPQMFSLAYTAYVKPTLLNEFRFAMSRTNAITYDALDNPSTGTQMKQLMQTLLPTKDFSGYQGLPLLVGPGSGALGFQTDVFSTGAFFLGVPASNPVGSRGNLPVTFGGFDPRWTFADTVSWTKGRHAFKGGIEVRRAKSYQEREGSGSFFNDANVYASAVGGATAYAPVIGIGYPNQVGLAGFSGFGAVGEMQGLLNYMSGSLANVRQYLFVNSPTALTWNNYSNGEDQQVFDIRLHEISSFFKDDWKVSNSLTLNLGLRWDWYGVPYVNSGMTVGLEGGSSSIFGISGNSFEGWLGTTPGTGGTLTNQIFVGPNSPNPDQQVFNDDYNNFGPAVGFSWQLPWFGKGTTTLRGGYQASFLPVDRADGFVGAIANTVGTSFRNVYTGTTGDPYLDIAHLSSYVPVPIPATAIPLAPISITDRTTTLSVYDPNLRDPYVQNLTLALVRNIGSNVTLDLRYVGTLSRKLLGTVNINTPNFIGNGLLEAFNAARSGGESPLLDKLFNGVNISGACGPVGSVCGGVLQTGAAQLRNSQMMNSSFQTFQSLLANGNYSGLAAALAVANYIPYYAGNGSLPAIPTGVNGALLRYTGTPENFIYTNPQFAAANLTGNMSYSNYHSFQAQVTVRPTKGISLVSTYTWSRLLGLNSGPYTDPTDRAADYSLLAGNRAHQLVTYGTWDLPFGQDRFLFKGVGRGINAIIGGWQMSWIGTVNSGSPNSITAATMLYNGGVPDFVGPAGSFDTKMGQVSWVPGAIGGNYFNDKYVKVRDPQCSGISPDLQGSCSLTAIALASDPSVIVFQNPQPGTRGNFGMNNITNLGRWNVDAALTKSFKIAEGKQLSIRIDALNVFNHQTPSLGDALVSSRLYIANAPDFNMTTTTYPFGFINEKVGNRNFQAKIRFDF
jgi:hypothetical protein